MKELLQAIKNKWFCYHDWVVVKEFVIHDEDNRYIKGYKYLFKCQKCGNFKIIKSY